MKYWRVLIPKYEYNEDGERRFDDNNVQVIKAESRELIDVFFGNVLPGEELSIGECDKDFADWFLSNNGVIITINRNEQ